MENHTDDGVHTKAELYRRQIALLRSFLDRGAITQSQFEKSAGDLSRLMGFPLSE